MNKAGGSRNTDWLLVKNWTIIDLENQLKN